VRVLESRGGDIQAFYDVAPDDGSPEVLHMAATSDNDYGVLVERGVEAATKWADAKGAETELRLLRVPALYVEALVLRTEGEEEETALVLRAPHLDVPLLTPVPLSELLGRLQEPARVLLEADDGLIGS
jgi:hypothetical protein